jgi:hypothetical protein
MTIPTIDALPTAPDRTDPPATFVTRADAFVAALPVLVTQTNAATNEVDVVSAQVTADALTASNSAAAAAGAANFVGAWSGLTGALNIPAGVSNNGSAWILTVNLADVTASEPTSSNTDWLQISAIPSQSGNAGKFLKSDGSALSWETPAAGVKSYTCSGTVAAGDFASVVGTVASKVDGTVTTSSVSAEATFEAGTMTVDLGRHTSCYDPTQGKTYKVYVDPDDGYFYVVAGTTTTAGVTTWDTANRAQINTSTCTDASIVYDVHNAQPIVAYNRSALRAVSLSITGDTISVSGEFGITGSSIDQLTIGYAGVNSDGNSNLLIAGRNTSGNAGVIYHFMNDAGSFANKSSAQYEGATDEMDMAIVKVGTPNGGMAITTYIDVADSSIGKMTLHEITSNTTMSRANNTNLDGGESDYTRVVYIEGLKAAFLFWENTDTSLPLYTVFPIPAAYNTSTPVINFSDVVPSMISFDACVIDVDKPSGLINFLHSIGGGNGNVRTYEVLGNNLILRATQTFNLGDTSAYSISSDTDNGFAIISFQDDGDTSSGKSVALILPVGKTNAYEFGGIFAEAGTDGNPVDVYTSGISANLTSIINGADYWIDVSGGSRNYPTGLPYIGRGRSTTEIELGLEEPPKTLWGKFKTKNTVVAGDPVAINSNNELQKITQWGKSAALFSNVLDFQQSPFDLSNDTWGQNSTCMAIDTNQNILLVCGVYYNGSSYYNYGITFDVSDPVNPVWMSNSSLSTTNVTAFNGRLGDLQFSEQTGQFLFVHADNTIMKARIIQIRSTGSLDVKAALNLPQTSTNNQCSCGYDPIEDKWVVSCNNGSTWYIGVTDVSSTGVLAFGSSTTETGLYGGGYRYRGKVLRITRDNTWALFNHDNSRSPYLRPFKINSGLKTVTFGTGRNLDSFNTYIMNDATWDNKAERIICTVVDVGSPYEIRAASFSVSANEATEDESLLDTGQRNGSTSNYTTQYFNSTLGKTVLKFETSELVLINGANLAGSMGTTQDFDISGPFGQPAGTASGMFFGDGHLYSVSYSSVSYPFRLFSGPYGSDEDNLSGFSGIVMQPQGIGGDTSVCFRGLLSGLSGLKQNSNYTAAINGTLTTSNDTANPKAISTTELIV